jgi:hypothetical protein
MSRKDRLGDDETRVGQLAASEVNAEPLTGEAQRQRRERTSQRRIDALNAQSGMNITAGPTERHHEAEKDPDDDVYQEICRRGEIFEKAADEMSSEEYDEALENLRQGWDEYSAAKRLRHVVEDLTVEAFDELTKNSGRPPKRRVRVREAFDGSWGTGNLLDLPSIPEAIWGKGDQQLWTPGDPLHAWAPTGSYKTGGLGVPLAAFRAGAAFDRLGHSDLWGFPVKSTDAGVLYLKWDRERQIDRIASRYSHYLGLDLNDYIEFMPFSVARQEMLLNQPEDFIQAMFDAVLDTLIVDSLQNVIGHEFPEEKLSKYLNFVKLAANAGIEIVTINHALKDVMVNGKLVKNSFRGSQAILDQTGTSLNIQLTSDTPQHAYLKVIMDKASVDTVDPFSLCFNKELGHPEVDESSTPPSRNLAFGSSSHEVKERVLDYIKLVKETNQKGVRDNVHGDDQSIRTALKELASERRIGAKKKGPGQTSPWKYWKLSE